MKLLYSGGDTIDLGSEVALPLNATANSITNAESYGRLLLVSAKFVTLNVGNEITITIEVSTISGATTPIEVFTETFTVTHPTCRWQMKYPVLLAASGGDDAFRIMATSDEGSGDDDSVAVTTGVYELEDICSIGGSRVTLTNNRLDVNTATSGGDIPISTDDIGDEVKKFSHR